MTGITKEIAAQREAVLDERQRLVAEARAAIIAYIRKRAMEGDRREHATLSWLADDIETEPALAPPSEGNKMQDRIMAIDAQPREATGLSATEAAALASRPQEQPRKATGEMDAWDQPEPLTPAKVAEWKAEAEELLFQTMEGPYSVILALCEHILSVSPAAAEGWQVITEIAAERQRQRTVEGWTNEHDDGHWNGSLASAAAAYALRGADRPLAAGDAWPVSWDRKWFKPKDRRRDLIRAGALIVAEIERRDRAAAPPSPAAQEQEKGEQT